MLEEVVAGLIRREVGAKGTGQGVAGVEVLECGEVGVAGEVMGMGWEEV